MGYSIKVLSNDEFDQLPYAYVNQAFAVTSPDKSNIYVRHTNIHDFNKMLVDHELDHLVEEVPTDEGPQGERYFLGSLLGGLGSLVSGLFTKALPAIGGGLFNLGKSAVGGIGNLLGGAGRTAGNLLGGTQLLRQFPGQTASSGIPLMPGGSQGGFINNFKQGFGGNPFGTSGGGGGGGFMSNLGRGFTSGIGSNIGQRIGSNLANTVSGIGSTLTNSNTALGGGLLAAGLNKKLPNVPELPQSIQQLQQQAQSGGSPLQQQAVQSASDLLGQEFNPLTDPEIDAITRQLDDEQREAIEALQKVYVNAQPGTPLKTNSEYQKDLKKTQLDFAQRKAEVVGNRTRDLKQNFDAQRLQQIQVAFGLSSQELQQRLALANYDVDKMYQQLQLDVAQTQFQQSELAGLGRDLIQPPISLFPSQRPF